MPPLDEAHLAYHRERLLALDAATPARWGGMDATRMVCHLRALVEASLGEIEIRRLVPTLLGKPLGFLFFDVFTRWPKGKSGSTPPMPALCPEATASFEEERRRLLDAYERFVARLAAEPRARTEHPIMGPTTLRRWSRVHGLHGRHHYRQFGLE